MSDKDTHSAAVRELVREMARVCGTRCCDDINSFEHCGWNVNAINHLYSHSEQLGPRPMRYEVVGRIESPGHRHANRLSSQYGSL